MPRCGQNPFSAPVGWFQLLHLLFWLHLLAGAALYAQDPNLVRGRRATLCYGVRCARQWRKVMPEDLKEWDSELGKYCNKCVAIWL